MTHAAAAGGRILPLIAALAVYACSPSVQLKAPEEPIRFDVNVRVTEEKRIQIDQELLSLIRQNPALFGFKPEQLPEEETQ